MLRWKPYTFMWTTFQLILHTVWSSLSPLVTATRQLLTLYWWNNFRYISKASRKTKKKKNRKRVRQMSLRFPRTCLPQTFLFPRFASKQVSNSERRYYSIFRFHDRPWKEQLPRCWTCFQIIHFLLPNFRFNQLIGDKVSGICFEVPPSTIFLRYCNTTVAEYPLIYL